MWRVGVAVLLVAACARPMAATAGPLDPVVPMLEFTGTGPTTAAFTLDGPVSFDLGNAVVTGRGRYAGVAVYTSSGRYVAGVVGVPELDGPPQQVALPHPWPLGPASVTLAAGRYRAYLLADADAEVRIRLDSGQSLAVTTTARVRETFYATHADVPNGASSLAFPRAVATRTATRTVVLGQFARGAATADVTLRICLTRHGTACTAQSTRVVSTAAGTVGGALRDSMSVPSSFLPRTPLDARAEATAAASYGATFGFAVIQFDPV